MRDVGGVNGVGGGRMCPGSDGREKENSTGKGRKRRGSGALSPKGV